MRQKSGMWSALVLGLACLSACTGADAVVEGDRAERSDLLIAPSDFVLAPCGRPTVMENCIVLAAGGKRVLLGAPAGVGAGKIAGDNIVPDGVILLSLHATAIEGLDEVRNRSWASNRRRPLIVAGADGVEQIVASMNEAYITSDALAYIEGKRRGGFDKEAIIANAVKPGDVAFDTGDLTVTAFAGGAGQLALLVNYNEQDLLLAGCGAGPEHVAAWPRADIYVGCEYASYPVLRTGAWPLTDAVKINQ